MRENKLGRNKAPVIFFNYKKLVAGMDIDKIIQRKTKYKGDYQTVWEIARRYQEIELLDREKKTMYINGVPAIQF